MGMNVNLTPQLEELVRSKVASGLYTSASEVVREALRLMDEQDRLREAKLAQLRSDVRRGLDSGPSETWDAEALKRFEGRSQGAVQHPDQRPVANLLRMAERVVGSGQRRDRGRSLREQSMARTAIHPGQHLAEQLKEHGMSAAELGRQLKVPTNRITGILNGQRAVTGDSALRLAHFFGTSAEFWLNLQKLYELRLAEAKAGAAIRRLPRLREGEKSELRRNQPGTA